MGDNGVGRMENQSALVALGSNLGEPSATLSRAAGRMDGMLPGVRLVARSRLWHSAPHEIEAAEYPLPEFLAVERRTGMSGRLALQERGGSTSPQSPPVLTRTRTASPWYANMVVRLECDRSVTPEALFDALMELEAELGRNRLLERRWGPRIVDIDLLAFGNEIRETTRLTLPHPRMWERAFVVLPLAEVAPEAVSPELLRRLSFNAAGTMLL